MRSTPAMWWRSLTDLGLGAVVAIVAATGTFAMLCLVALFGAALRRLFPAKRP